MSCFGCSSTAIIIPSAGTETAPGHQKAPQQLEVGMQVESGLEQKEESDAAWVLVWVFFLAFIQY